MKEADRTSMTSIDLEFYYILCFLLLSVDSVCVSVCYVVFNLQNCGFLYPQTWVSWPLRDDITLSEYLGGRIMQQHAIILKSLCFILSLLSNDESQLGLNYLNLVIAKHFCDQELPVNKVVFFFLFSGKIFVLIRPVFARHKNLLNIPVR